MEIDLSKVTLRPFKLEDADDFLSFADDDQVTRNPSRWETLTSKEEALTHIKDACIPHPWRRSICMDDRSIGFVSIFPFSGDDKCRASFGYGVAVKYWGHGIATKAVKMAVSQFFVEFPGVVRLEALVDVDNKASQRVVEKAGFQKEGLLRKYAHVKGKLRDLFLYSFLSSDFHAAEGS
ncbi:uncharacterized protein LOC111277901 [Durio zibethinus]|uniref:Uncharacterized protein LOC111277901 n=1 Tax=Durio zibethinus TaxID=66656 RepID=A0A6P5WW48_DURZI|nr:uncharacterized protein LOC111277901 [Durio zibethinus]